jgi:hypothetical protein
MDGRNLLVTLNGISIWAYVIEQPDGLRIRFSLDDWERVFLQPGQRVPIRLPDGSEPKVFVDRVRQEPPFVWVTAVPRMLASR